MENGGRKNNNDRIAALEEIIKVNGICKLNGDPGFGERLRNLEEWRSEKKEKELRQEKDSRQLKYIMSGTFLAVLLQILKDLLFK